MPNVAPVINNFLSRLTVFVQFVMQTQVYVDNATEHTRI